MAGWESRLEATWAAYERGSLRDFDNTHQMANKMQSASRATSSSASGASRSGGSGAIRRGGHDIKIELHGVESTIEHLKIVGDKELPKELTRLLRENAKPVLAAARAAAPVRTGNLRSKTKLNVAAAKGRVSIVARTHSSRKLDYAAPIHWGWDARGIEPNPYVWDTWQAMKDDVLRNVDRDLTRWAEKASARLNRNVRAGTRQVLN